MEKGAASMKMKRRIIQIATSMAGTYREALYALCDDGTLWEQNGRMWIEVEGPPPFEVEPEVSLSPKAQEVLSDMIAKGDYLDATPVVTRPVKPMTPFVKVEGYPDIWECTEFTHTSKGDYEAGFYYKDMGHLPIGPYKTAQEADEKFRQHSSITYDNMR